MAYYIGVDAGSTLCKAAIFDRDGRQLAEAQRRTPMRTGPRTGGPVG